MAATDIDSSLKMALKTAHGASRKYRYSLRPDSGSVFSPGDMVRFQIPTRKRNTFLVNSNCYLKATVKRIGGDTVTNCRFDGSAASMIHRIDEYSSGNLLSSLDNYNALFDVLFTSKVSQSSEKSYDIWMGVDAPDLNNDVIGRGREITIAGATVAIPLLCPVTGAMSDVNLPVHAIDDLRVEIQLSDLTNGYVRAAGVTLPTIQIEDMTLELEFLELSDASMAMAEQFRDSDGSLTYHASGFRAYTSTLQANAAGVHNQLINAKYSSLKTIYSVFLDQQGAAGGYSTTSRPKYIDTFQLKVGSALVPAKPINNTTDFFLYNQMAHHVSPASFVSRGSTNKVRFENTITASSDTYKNDFYAAVSTDSISGMDHLMMSGVNTIGENLFAEFTMSDGNKPALYCVHFAEYDTVVAVRDGQVTVRF